MDSTSIISPSVNDTCSCFAVFVLLALSMLVNCYCGLVWCLSNQGTEQAPCGRCIGGSDHGQSKPRPGANGTSNVIRRKNRRRKKGRRKKVCQYDRVRGELPPEDLHSTI